MAARARDREARRGGGRSDYITPEGFARLQEELDWLWRVERPKVTEAVSRAAALGDRSENADYIYGKKRLREIDSRLRFLQKRTDELKVVDRPPDRQDKVFFGAWVTVEDEAGEARTYRIVGPDEFEPDRAWISMDSPLGKALLGKEEGDEFSFRRPKGDQTLAVVEIRYTPPDAD
jgi:transcription elongation factor GreB